jgi:hypothetical protein
MDAIRLSQELYATLLEAERQLLDQVPEFTKAEECGIDCQGFRQMSSLALDRIQKLKQNYAPLER